MKLKRITFCAIVSVIVTALVGCSSGGLVGVHNPVPNKAQTATSSDISSQGVATVDYTSVAKRWIDSEDTWTHADEMPLGGINGIYSTGYYLFDIDLDGDKELLVQLGGNQSQNCKTLIYKLGDTGEISSIPVAEELSYSVQNITLFSGNDDKFYINESTLKNDSGVFITSWNKMNFHDGMLTQEPLFYQHITYDKLTGNIDYMYHYSADGTTYLTDEEFTEQFNTYLDGFTQIMITPMFIKSSEWQYYTHNQKINTIVNALKK